MGSGSFPTATAITNSFASNPNNSLALVNCSSGRSRGSRTPRTAGSPWRASYGTSGRQRGRLRSNSGPAPTLGIRDSKWLEKKSNIPLARTACLLSGSPTRVSGPPMPLWSRWLRLDWSSAERLAAAKPAPAFASQNWGAPCSERRKSSLFQRQGRLVFLRSSPIWK